MINIKDSCEFLMFDSLAQISDVQNVIITDYKIITPKSKALFSSSLSFSVALIKRIDLDTISFKYVTKEQFIPIIHLLSLKI